MAEVRNHEVTAHKMKATWMHVYLNNNNNHNYRRPKYISKFNPYSCRLYVCRTKTRVSQSPATQPACLGSITGHSMSCLWWTKCHWDKTVTKLVSVC